MKPRHNVGDSDRANPRVRYLDIAPRAVLRVLEKGRDVMVRLFSPESETIDGVVGGVGTISSRDWAWAKCSAANPFPGTPDPTRICLKNGFNPALNYYVVFTAKDPYVLGIGFAAFRDVGSFFKNEAKDERDASADTELDGEQTRQRRVDVVERDADEEDVPGRA